jgi:hypothetical protein
MLKLLKNIFFLLIIYTSTTFAQSFGFGCLGFVGGFGGYNYQQYKPNGLNQYVVNFNTSRSEYLENEMSEFNKATGYRIGVNFFRAKLSGFFITAKGFYQQSHEEHNAIVYQTAFGIDYEYDLKLKSWGFGVDLGIPLFHNLSWKIIDGSLLLNSARFTETTNSSQGTSVVKYDNDKTEIGYSVGTGFIFDIIKNYVSIEGVASYTHISINKMVKDDGVELIYNSNTSMNSEKFINSGGFNAVVQLNLGFPL